MSTPIATGFDFEPLKDGNVLIEFFGDDGHTFNTQVVTSEVLRSMPMVAMLTMVAMQDGVEAVKKLMDRLNKDCGQDAS
ncbi:MAG: hypothetical protein HQ567_11010 [Candidatus Nealsonbacteria bacterium]|nr:hypothetical protein [Candidatus Nealsonbacteria bacterium]